MCAYSLFSKFSTNKEWPGHSLDLIKSLFGIIHRLEKKLGLTMKDGIHEQGVKQMIIKIKVIIYNYFLSMKEGEN